MTGIRDERIEVQDAAEFGRVAVMLGGASSEREVSLQTGTAVLKALESRQIDAHAFDPSEQGFEELARGGFARVWNALHGPGGEDGTILGALEWLGIPYTGSGVGASALAMDKIRSKYVFAATGIATPEYRAVTSMADAHLAADEFGYPLVFKPAGQGSSIGMSKVFDVTELGEAVELALSFGEALAERCIVGDEVTVAILQGRALPSVRIETPRVFYDYRAKYESDNTRYFCPASDDAEVESLYADLATRAFEELGCAGWGRVDFMHDRERGPLVLEVNTVPGMTGHSLVPMAAKAAGIDFPELCWRILETSFTAAPATNAGAGAARRVGNGS